MYSKINLIVLVIAFISASLTNAQLSETQRLKIDSLVANWNAADKPGGVIGIMKQGRVLYTKGFGLASLDYDVPNAENTLFNIGSVSKQFTAMGIIKLQQEGKLSIDDNIRKYLPEIPDFGQVITIRHLLHHTSGLRDIHSLLAIAGWGDDDPRSDDDLFRIMKNQKELNFNPGEEYMYCNTGYIFMARIIELVTGEKFENWMKRSIFEPLGLSDTYIENNSAHVVKGNATSYNMQKDSSYTRAVEYWNYVGSGNVHTTAKDLLTWLNNFTDPGNDWKASFDMLQTTDTLNNGKKNNYAFGVEIVDNKGERIIQHGGSVGGFRAYVSVFTNNKLCIVVLTNYSSSQPQQKLNLLTGILIPELAQKPGSTEKKNVKYPYVPNDNLEKYAGDYWTDAVNVSRKLYVKNNTLWFFRSKGNESPLQYIGNDEFIMLNTESGLKVKFLFIANNVKTMLVGAGDPNNQYKSYTPVKVSAQYLSEFTGKFRSPELNTYYTFTIKNDTLTAYHPKFGYFNIEVLKKDIFRTTKPLGTIIYIRDASRKIIGIRVSYDRVKNLWMEKTSEL